MLKNTSAFAILLVLAISGTASALTPYFSTGITSGIQNNGHHASTSYNTLWTLNAGVQYALNSNISMRNGIEFSTGDYTFKNDIGNIRYEYDTNTQIYLGNVTATFRPTGFRSGVYAGITAGITNYKTTLKSPVSAPSESHSTFTYGASAGISLNIISALYIDLGLRYLTTADAGTDGNLITTGGIRLGF